MLGWSSARYCVCTKVSTFMCVWLLWDWQSKEQYGLCECARTCVCVWSVSYLTFEVQCGFNHESSALASIIVVLWAYIHLSQRCMELRLQSFINKPEIRMKEEEILLKSIKHMQASSCQSMVVFPSPFMCFCL